jgi:hypothetical protein
MQASKRSEQCIAKKEKKKNSIWLTHLHTALPMLVPHQGNLYEIPLISVVSVGIYS